ncbi:ATP-dependent RecD-like DNA helicase [bacterium]|nr:ATP-dependent RecD-like DNA helicase [bacterium]
MHLTGIVKTVVFRNEQTSFTVLNLEVTGEPAPIRAVGTIGPVKPGDSLHCEGEWETHARFGRNFKIMSCQMALPQTEQGLEAFLQSGHINGIGPKMAQEIIQAFGLDTIRILDEQPERLCELPHIGRKRLEAIKQGWRELKSSRADIIFLQGLGLSRTYVNKAIQRFGDQAALTIRNNPYALTQISGIGFHRADNVAREMGLSLESEARTRAGLEHTMSECISDGHCCYPRDDFLIRAEQLLKIGPVYIEPCYRKMVQEGRFVEKAGQKTLVFRTDLAHAEWSVATHLKRIVRGPFEQRQGYETVDLVAVDRLLGLTLSSGQLKAIRTVLDSKIVIITGGPGTGKTTVVRAIIALARALDFRLKLAAPTGRAAQRMKEISGVEAHTIHRLLEYNPVLASFMKNDKSPLEADVVIIDEVSMIDIFLMSSLVRAIDDKTQLVLVGDADQLPSVGPGNVLGDLININHLPVVRLTEIFRQAERSLITSNAHRINQGQKPTFAQERSPAWENDFYFIPRDTPQEAVSTLVQVVTNRIPQAFGLDPLRDVQVLTPVNNGPTGAIELNARLQKELNPPRNHSIVPGPYPDLPFQIGDRIMQIRNNYNRGSQGVFNGDIGFVQAIDQLKRTLTARFDENISYDFDDLNELTLAYAITIHKSQGSEYPAVVLPLLTQHYVMLQRNLIYTAVTRARKLVVLIGSHKALSMAISNTQTAKRFTGLKNLFLEQS